MCGVFGIVNGNSLNNASIKKSLQALRHRGPDGHGIWEDSEKRVALAHTRLSIIDTSTHGHQPMVSHSGRYILTYNGEIYNFLDLRKDLVEQGCHFTSSSDTEVLLQSVEQWGIKKTLEKIDGMFAFGVYDQKEKKIYLARDRFGEKPLYYSRKDKSLYFASELKALNSIPGVCSKISQEAVDVFLSYSYIPAPLTIYESVFKLEPAHYAVFDLESGQLVIKKYWNAEKTALGNQTKHLIHDEGQAIYEVDKALTSSLKNRKISDVPIGCFLSGGIDSSLIATYYQSLSNTPIQTFTIGNENKEFNEAHDARLISKYLGTQHTELYVTKKDYIDIIPNLSNIYDEPFADSSQIPTLLVSKLARQYVTVALTGDGGDELFGGYNRHISAPDIYKKFKKIPSFMRVLSCSGLKILSKNSSFNQVAKNLGDFNHVSLKIQKTIQALESATSEEAFYLALCKTGVFNEIVSKFPLPSKYFMDQSGFSQWMMLADTVTYLPGDILAKVDRASMAYSLETRAPYLSKDLFETAWRLPLTNKIRHKKGKWILRELLKKKIPTTLFEGRPKSGFGVPLSDWLRSDLKKWGESLLFREKANIYDYISQEKVEKIWMDHQHKKMDNSYSLWNILMLEQWFESNKNV